MYQSQVKKYTVVGPSHASPRAPQITVRQHHNNYHVSNPPQRSPTRQPQQRIPSRQPPQRSPTRQPVDRYGRRRTTGFEEIRQEYYKIHQNKHNTNQGADEEEFAGARTYAQTRDENFYPKPRAFMKTQRRQEKVYREPSQPQRLMNDTEELFGESGGFAGRGNKAASMFQRARERTDQFIIDESNVIDKPRPPLQPTMPQPGRPKIRIQQNPWDAAAEHPLGRPDHAFQTVHQPQRPTQSLHQHQPVHAQSGRSPASPMRQNSDSHQGYMQQQQQQQHYNPPQQQQQQQHYNPPQQQQHYNPPQQQQQHYNPPQQQQYMQPSHTSVDSGRQRTPHTPTSPRVSPWKGPDPFKRFHDNVTPYEDNYNTSPRGWNTSAADDLDYGENFSISTSREVFKFQPAPRINKFGAPKSAPYSCNYNSRPKSFGMFDDVENTHPSHGHQGHPAQRQMNASSVRRDTGPSNCGFRESDEL